MAAIDEVDDVSGIISDVVKETFHSLMWKWYYQHKNDRVAIHVWIISTSIRIEQLYPLFVRLFGEDTVLNNG